MAADLMQSEVITVNENQNLEEAFHLFGSRRITFLPVLSGSGDNQVVGCLKREDLITAYNQHVLQDQVKPSARWICKVRNQNSESRNQKSAEK